MPPTGFHNILDVAAAQKVGANTRVFKGEGTLFLKVPGLLRLDSVAHEGHVWPAKHRVRYPVDLSERREEVEMDMVHLTNLPDGTPVLLRNVCSNDGFWQKSYAFLVTGEWAEDVPAPPVDEEEEPVVIKKGQR